MLAYINCMQNNGLHYEVFIHVCSVVVFAPLLLLPLLFRQSLSRSPLTLSHHWLLDLVTLFPWLLFTPCFQLTWARLLKLANNYSSSHLPSKNPLTSSLLQTWYLKVRFCLGNFELNSACHNIFIFLLLFLMYDYRGSKWASFVNKIVLNIFFTFH